MAQVKGNVSDEHLWGVICDELHDEYPIERVRWLRGELSQVTVGMVWRAAPRLRGLIEGHWPQWHVNPRGMRHVAPAQMVRLLLVEGPDERAAVWAAVERMGFKFKFSDRRRQVHPQLGAVAVPMRTNDGQRANWLQWHALYQERWGLEEADYELARHSYVNGGSFGEGGLEGLLEDLRVEVQRQEDALTAAVDAYDQRILEIAGLLPEELQVSTIPRSGWAVENGRVVNRTRYSDNIRQGWTHRGVDMSIALDALLGSHVEIERDALTAQRRVMWEGVSVTVSDQEAVRTEGPEALARDIVRRLVDARRAMPNPPTIPAPPLTPGVYTVRVVGPEGSAVYECANVLFQEDMDGLHITLEALPWQQNDVHIYLYGDVGTEGLCRVEWRGVVWAAQGMEIRHEATPQARAQAEAWRRGPG